MESLLQMSALILGLAISANTIYFAIRKYFEKRRQRVFMIKRLDLEMANIMKNSERILNESYEIAKLHQKIYNFKNDKILTSELKVKILHFMERADTIVNRKLELDGEKISILLNDHEIKILLDFLDKLQSFRDSISYRVTTLKRNPENSETIADLDKHVEDRFNKLREEFLKVRNIDPIKQKNTPRLKEFLKNFILLK